MSEIQYLSFDNVTERPNEPAQTISIDYILLPMSFHPNIIQGDNPSGRLMKLNRDMHQLFMDRQLRLEIVRRGRQLRHQA